VVEVTPKLGAYAQECIQMWVVQLTGGASDLAALAQSLTGGKVNVSRNGRDYVLTSDQFASSDEAGVVRQKAENMVAVLNGATGTWA
jgi:hypothetical protein